MRRRWTWIPIFLFLFSLGVRLVAARLASFDGLYGQDPFAYLAYADQLKHALAAGQPPPAFFWPIGYPVLVALFSSLNGTMAGSGQLVSMLTGAAIAPLAYWLVVTIDPEASTGGLVAGLLASVSGQLMISSLSVMADTAALMWAMVSAYCLLRYVARLHSKWLVMSAALLAFALLTRWIYALLALPWGISAIMAWRAAEFRWRQMIGAALSAFVAGSAIIALHFAADISRGGLSYVGDLQVYSWHPANALRRTLTNADGRFVYERLTGIFYAIPSVHPSYLFPLLSPFALIGLWRMREQSRAQSALLIGWPAIVFLFLAGVPWQNWRFPLSYFAPLLVMVGLGVGLAWRRLDTGQKSWLIAWCGLALVGSLIWAARDVHNFATWTNSSRQAAIDVGAAIPPDATLLVFGLTATLQYETEIETHELFNLTNADLERFVSSPGPLYLLIDPANVNDQWSGRAPELRLRWLEKHSDLQLVGQYETYTLYQVAR